VTVGSPSALNSSLLVGYGGTGSLLVEEGGTIHSPSATIGVSNGWANMSSFATVVGTGATWVNDGELQIIGYGCTIGYGGRLTSQSVTVESARQLNLHVYGNGMLVLGSASAPGYIENISEVNISADAFMPSGVYRPITEYAGRDITWDGTDGYNAYGGVWDNAAKTFTVATTVASGASISNAVYTGERLLITDPIGGKRVGVSFGAVADGVNFQADPLDSGTLSKLMAVMPVDQSVLGGWNFTMNSSSDQTLLSFEIGAGLSDLDVWHFDGTWWREFTAPDLTYGDDGIANFAVTALGSYAVTGVLVPEPCSLLLLALGGLALLRRRG